MNKQRRVQNLIFAGRFPMQIFHYNDEEKDLHAYLAAKRHANTILPASADPFAEAAEKSFDAAFIGLHPHGLELIRTLKRTNPECLVTIITSDKKTRMAVEAMKRGAFDYLLSPLDFTEVERTYILVEREQRMLQERRQLQAQLAAATANSRLVGASEPMRQLRQLIARGCATRAPVLLIGETGTGKELVAQLLHEQSPRCKGKFISINCNSIPSGLMESELFGHRKGSFTGASDNREGLLAEADGGTCFLDEIQDLDMMLQGKLLRVLQHGEILPIGERRFADWMCGLLLRRTPILANWCTSGGFEKTYLSIECGADRHSRFSRQTGRPINACPVFYRHVLSARRA